MDSAHEIYLTLAANAQTVFSTKILFRTVLMVSLDGPIYDIVYAPTAISRQVLFSSISGRLKFHDTADTPRTVLVVVKD